MCMVSVIYFVLIASSLTACIAARIISSFDLISAVIIYDFPYKLYSSTSQ